MTEERVYNFPVWGAQGGGLVREIETVDGYKCIFVEAPDPIMGLTVGDYMPEEWDLIPANELARQVMLQSEGSCYDSFEYRDPDYYDRVLGKS